MALNSTPSQHAKPSECQTRYPVCKIGEWDLGRRLSGKALHDVAICLRNRFVTLSGLKDARTRYEDILKHTSPKENKESPQVHREILYDVD